MAAMNRLRSTAWVAERSSAGMGMFPPRSNRGESSRDKERKPGKSMPNVHRYVGHDEPRVYIRDIPISRLRACEGASS